MNKFIKILVLMKKGLKKFNLMIHSPIIFQKNIRDQQLNFIIHI